MSSITILGMSQAALAATGKGSPADAGENTALDFNALLDAGLAPGADPGTLPASDLPGSIPGHRAGTKDGATPARDDDPAELLDAIAAAQAADPKAAPTPAQAPIVPALATLPQRAAGASAAAVESDPTRPATDTKGRASRPSLAVAEKPEKTADAAAVRADGAPPRFEPVMAAARQNPMAERGAAGELRAEILSKSVPESQAATHLLHAQASRHAPEPAARMEPLQQPIGTPAWNDGVADRVMWMAKNDLQTAELHLNPADLGPIEITLTLTGDDKTQAAVQFSAAHASTRDAIETALPRLREMLQESGITLGQAGVDANNSRAADGGGDRTAGNGQSDRRSPGDTSGILKSAPLPAPAATRSLGSGLVDTFA